MNTKHKRIAIVVALCGAALAVDKMILGPPDAADGSEFTVDPAAPAPPETAGPAPTTGATASLAASASARDARATLVRRLVRAEAAPPDASAVIGTFRDPAEWFRVREGTGPDADGDLPADRHADFRRTWILGATVPRPTGGSIILSGQSVSVGEWVDGYRLAFVGDRVARFDSDLGPVELMLARPDVESRSGRTNRAGPPSGDGGI